MKLPLNYFQLLFLPETSEKSLEGPPSSALTYSTNYYSAEPLERIDPFCLQGPVCITAKAQRPEVNGNSTGSSQVDLVEVAG